MKRSFYECVIVAGYFIAVTIMTIFSVVYLKFGWVFAPDCVKGLLLPIVIVANLVGHQLFQNEVERSLGLLNLIDEEELS